MSKFLIFGPLLVVTLFPVYYIFLKPAPPLPDMDLQAWWGPEEWKNNATTDIKDFKIKFDAEMIMELRERIKSRSKYTPPLDGVGFEYGFNSRSIGQWLEYWANEYPFAERQEFLNKYPHHVTQIQGLDIHFIRVTPNTSPRTEKVPVLMLHGWPGSVREFYEAIPLLTAASKNRDFALELIIPSLPGYGYSSAAVRPGLGANEMAVVFRNLMQRLGFKKYYVQGGDWGAMIGSSLVTLFPGEVLGFHTNMGYVLTGKTMLLSTICSYFPSLIVDSKYASRMYPLKDHYSNLIEEMGYMHIQATKPDTVGFGLQDSPAGLMAYILEKFSSWTNMENRKKADGGLEIKWTKEKLIDNIMVYWSSRSITTSMRLYAESFSLRHMDAQIDEIPTPVPTWVLQAPHELGYVPPFLLKFKYPNLVKANPIDDGGHFIAFEMPEVFAEDVLNAIAAFRKLGKSKTEL